MNHGQRQWLFIKSKNSMCEELRKYDKKLFVVIEELLISQPNMDLILTESGCLALSFGLSIGIGKASGYGGCMHNIKPRYQCNFHI